MPIAQRLIVHRGTGLRLCASFVALSLSACLSNPDVTLKLVDRTQDATNGVYVQTGRLPADKIGSGAAIGDLNGDGRLDVVFARAPDSPGGPPMLWLNDGTGLRFVEAPDFEPLGGGRMISGVALGDYDNDGDLDVFFSALGADLLLRNRGDGTFDDVTEAAGVNGADDDRSSGATWVDVNDDGLLDLYVTNFIDVNVELSAQGPLTNRSANRLYLNLGNGRFLDVTQAAGIDAPGATHVAAMADVDGDGIVELYVANDRFDVGGVSTGDARLPADQIWRRTSLTAGIPKYENMAQTSGFEAPRSSMGFAFPDIDHDGKPEVYVSDYGGNDLYYYHANTKTFTEGAQAVGLELADAPQGGYAVGWGLLSLDLDRDGTEEMLVVNGQVPGSNPQTLVYLEQTGEQGYFEPVVESAGLNQVTHPDYIQWARGAYTGDLDGDGDDDIVVSTNGGVFAIYENQSVRLGASVRVRLVGTVSAPVPVGAKVVLTLSDGTQLVRQQTAGGAPYGQSDPTLDLVTADRSVESMEIDWPSGFVERIAGTGVQPVGTISEPRWLELSTRNVAAGASATLTLTAFDETGAALGAAGSGRDVTVTRSDGTAVAITDVGDGTYTAEISHPGVTSTISLAITIDGKLQAISPMITFE